MKLVIWLIPFFFVLIQDPVFGNSNFSKEEYSANFFRAPSVGGEYRKDQFSIHGGYYVTNFDPGITTEFYKVGFGYWFLPTKLNSFIEQPSSFYTYLSYGKGINLGYKNKDSFMYELGYRFMLWKGLSFRFGIILLVADGASPELNPTPGISYSVFF
ncbi:hypothetical protein [Leptospira bandrabouensis]|uniref:Uncharacterized protein n=1 Tax=Leptospira bandrabouensis TaxID=2484903 RepID=A0A6H3NXE1_9LEPT|nr:hypothetical protein [Leptospira bandrabouensis]MCG6145579.1 hypothetical protein [Leptospira bandrabouensis]MCG6153398.1 hypothetical protein [Leptospira bandrabouensis]MCG6160881.1 hypothetical protein [Leptospira bandrabouensis]MCG6165419.1 hypothetical protein [Leptospira bandrabouensis]MCW7460200.1 hypothetical protein [Leptospira bandrabouensis]